MIFLVITPRKKDVAAHPFFLSKFKFFKKNLMIMQVKEFIINKELDDGGIVMKLFQVINLAREYLVLGIIGLIFIGIIYILFFRKFFKNHVKANIKK